MVTAQVYWYCKSMLNFFGVQLDHQKSCIWLAMLSTYGWWVWWQPGSQGHPAGWMANAVDWLELCNWLGTSWDASCESPAPSELSPGSSTSLTAGVQHTAQNVPGHPCWQLVLQCDYTAQWILSVPSARDGIGREVCYRFVHSQLLWRWYIFLCCVYGRFFRNIFFTLR